MLAHNIRFSPEFTNFDNRLCVPLFYRSMNAITTVTGSHDQSRTLLSFSLACESFPAGAVIAIDTKEKDRATCSVF